VPSALNWLVNGVHRRVSAIAGRLRTAERRLLKPDYASTFHNLAYAVRAAWHARRWRSDVIHIHNFSQFVPVMRVLNPRARIVLHMNCEWLSQHDPPMIERRIAKADAIVCCSAHVRRQLLDRFPKARARAHVVYNGGNVERFPPRSETADGPEPGPLRLVFVGRISPEKGVHILVDAFAELAPSMPEVALDLIGGAGSLPPEFLLGLSRDPLVQGLRGFYESDYLAEIRRRIPDALRERVVFHGNQPHERLAELYREGAVFVCPSFSDAFPLTIVEAMAAGLPVVGSEVGGIPESVVDGQTGVLVRPGSVAELVAALRRLLEHRALRQRMGAAGRERALTLFSWRAISEEIDRVYGGGALVGPPERPTSKTRECVETSSRRARIEPA